MSELTQTGSSGEQVSSIHTALLHRWNVRILELLEENAKLKAELKAKDDLLTCANETLKAELKAKNELLTIANQIELMEPEQHQSAKRRRWMNLGKQ